MTELERKLAENTLAALELSAAERIKIVRHTRWIEYDRAKEILDTLKELLEYPNNHRMPNFLIEGSTNNGKTMIIDRFYKNHPPSDNKTGDFVRYPVLVVQAPPLPDEGRLYNEILETLHAPYKERDAPAKKEFQVFRLLEQISTKILIIDEIHDILAGTPVKQQQFLNVIKRLGNRLQIPIIGVGTEQASNVLQSDPQLANRFESLKLPRWSMDDDFVSLLANFERTLPLKEPSNLHDEELAIELHMMSEGLIGELNAVLTKACVEAIKKKTEKITLKILKSIKWSQPSDRKRSLGASA